MHDLIPLGAALPGNRSPATGRTVRPVVATKGYTLPGALAAFL